MSQDHDTVQDLIERGGTLQQVVAVLASQALTRGLKPLGPLVEGLPSQVGPLDHCVDQLAECAEQLRAAEGLSLAQAAEAAKAFQDQLVAEHHRVSEQRRLRRQTLTSLIEQAGRWQVEPEIEWIKAMVLGELQNRLDNVLDMWELPAPQTAEQYRKAQIEAANSHLKHAQEAYNRQSAAAAERNREIGLIRAHLAGEALT